ncbi:MAG: hypothetical protein ACOY33_05820 [Pseudomonadota bacterium]
MTGQRRRLLHCLTGLLLCGLCVVAVARPATTHAAAPVAERVLTLGITPENYAPCSPANSI